MQAAESGHQTAAQADLFPCHAQGILIKPRKESRKGKGRACLRCRQLRRKCDDERPCRQCAKRGDECKVDDAGMSCIPCRTARIKCDKQQPCSSCVKKGISERCASQVENGVSLFNPLPNNLRKAKEPGPAVIDTQLWFEANEKIVPHIDNIQNTDFGKRKRTELHEKPAIVRKKKKEINHAEIVHETPDSPCLPPSPLASLVHQPKIIRLTDSSPVRAQISATIRNQIMRRAWEAGYSFTALEQLFGNLPLGLQDAMNQGLEALQTLAWAKAQTARLAQPAGHGTVATVATAASPGEEGAMESELTELYDDLHCGWWCLSYDTATGRRASLRVNRTLAAMLGMHPEELLSRAGNSDVPLPQTQLEFFCAMLDDLCVAAQPRVVRYATLTPQIAGKMQDTVLVRRESLREFTPDGKIVSMQHFLSRVSEADFDAALLRDPAACRPFLASALGDVRSASDLLATASTDFLFDQHIAVMTQSPLGRAQLGRLEAALRVRFEPLLQAAAAVLRRVGGEGAGKHTEYVYQRVEAGGASA